MAQAFVAAPEAKELAKRSRYQPRIDGGVVVDANSIGIATAIPPPPTAIAVRRGIDVDDVVPRTRLDAGVADASGVAPAAVPPPAAIAVGGSIDIDSSPGIACCNEGSIREAAAVLFVPDEWLWILT